MSNAHLPGPSALSAEVFPALQPKARLVPANFPDCLPLCPVCCFVGCADDGPLFELIDSDCMMATSLCTLPYLGRLPPDRPDSLGMSVPYEW